MEKMFIRLSQDWSEYKTGTTLRVPEETGKDLIEKGLAVQAEDPTEVAQKKQAAETKRKAEEKRVTDLAEAKVAEMMKNAGLVGTDGKPLVTTDDKGALIIEGKDPKITVVKDPADEGFKSFGDQLMSVKTFVETGKMDVRQEAINKAASGFNEGVDADGGLLVQQEFQSALQMLAIDTDILPSYCDVVNIGEGKNGLYWNALKEDSRATGSRRGGLQVYRTHEAADYTKSQSKFERRGMILEKLTGLYYATDELMEDQVALGNLVAGWFGEEFGFRIDLEIMSGTGGGQMLGLLNSDALVQIAKESGQAAATIVTDNLMKMWQSMWPRGLSRAIWLINQECWHQLMTLTMAVGTGGRAVWMPPNGLESAPYGMIFGRPVIPIEQCEALGTVGDIMFVDLSQYRVIQKGGVKSASSIHVRFVQGETAFRFSMRNNGQSLWKKAVTPFKGSISVSPFMSLATRA